MLLVCVAEVGGVAVVVESVVGSDGVVLGVWPSTGLVPHRYSTVPERYQYYCLYWSALKQREGRYPTPSKYQSVCANTLQGILVCYQYYKLLHVQDRGTARMA